MSEKKQERRGLGRGLSALMAEVGVEGGTKAEIGNVRRTPGEMIPIERIRPNSEQPRRQFSEQALEDLAASIRAKGVIQPLILRVDPVNKEHYQIVAGERRWRAAQMAQLHELPAVIRDLDDTEVLEIAIIENIQRADLNAVEEAVGYRQLMDRFGHTQEKLAEALGKSRSHIANLLRLLSLPDDVLEHLRGGAISAGHARALVTSEDPSGLASKVIRNGLSVRQTESMVKAPRAKASGAPRSAIPAKDADTRALEQDLSASLGLAVSIDHAAGAESGKLTIGYRTLEDLDDICRLLSVSRD